MQICLLARTGLPRLLDLFVYILGGKFDSEIGKLTALAFVLSARAILHPVAPPGDLDAEAVVALKLRFQTT